MSEAAKQASELLKAMAEGDPHAAEALLPLVYDALRQLAAQHLAREPASQTLDATALVHEAYLKLVGNDTAVGDRWKDQRHFYYAAAQAMRRILVDRARRKRSQKRGGDRQRSAVDAADLPAPARHDDLLAVDDALTKLAAVDAAAAELVHLRYFAGLTIPEAAQMLGMSGRSADRLWAYARAWLLRELR